MTPGLPVPITTTRVASNVVVSMPVMAAILSLALDSHPVTITRRLLDFPMLMGSRRLKCPLHPLHLPLRVKPLPP